MRVLIVCSYRDYIKDGIAPFIKEQVTALQSLGIECAYYQVRGKGVWGYLQELPKLRKKIRQWKPNIIHAHFGLSGLLANLVTRRIPVVTTYHGSDINNPSVYRYSKFAIRLSAWNIYVSTKNMEIAGAEEGNKASLIPCGIDDTLFKPIEKKEARDLLVKYGKFKEKSRTKYVLFTKMFDDPVKDYPLAKAVIDRVNNEELGMKSDEVELLEFTGYTREQSALLMNAVDAILMTSKTEGSPQVVKEAMACGCPIVSVDVGDVKERISRINGCYVANTREPEKLAGLLHKALVFEGKTNGREAFVQQNLSNELVAQKILEIYNKVLRK